MPCGRFGPWRLIALREFVVWGLLAWEVGVYQTELAVPSSDKKFRIAQSPLRESQ